MNKPFFKPAILVEDANGIHPLQSRSLLLKHRVIFIDDKITSDTANEIVRQVLLLCMDSKDPITLLLDTPGGSIQAGFQLLDLLEACPCIVRTVALGCAASMGAVLLAAGTKGYRFISTRSRAMLHEPQLTGGVSGSTSHIETVSQQMKARREIINKLLCAYTEKDMKAVRKATSYEHYFSAQEAVAFGLADTVVTEKDLFYCILGGAIYE